MLNFREYLIMGGNVVLDGNEAQRIDLTKISRKDIVADIDASLSSINSAFKKFSGFPMWNDDLFKSKKFLSGSAFHFFNVDNINDDEFVRVKDSVGDIDTQVDGVHSETLKKFLDASKGATFSDLTLIGYKFSAGQYISLWKSKKYDMNIQVDLELVDFDSSGHPTPWSQFSHSSAWEDLLLGIKGVAHKYIFRALNAKDHKEIIIQPKTSRGKEKTVTTSELAFSLSGLRVKFEPVLDDKGKQLVKDGKPVYKELDTSDSVFITDLGVLFKVQFGKDMSGNEEKKLMSFTGVVELIKKYYSKSNQLAVADGFAKLLWGDGAQSLYRNDKLRDLKEKTAMINTLADILDIQRGRWDTLISGFYK